MSVFTTDQGTPVPHCHLYHLPCKLHELSANGIAVARAKAHDINAAAIELDEPTRKYNCHGYAYAISHGWFNYPDLFLDDDYDRVELEDAQIGDIVIYKNGSTLMHSATIVRIDAAGIAELHSKWGELALLSHSLDGVPDVYGAAKFAVRRRT